MWVRRVMSVVLLCSMLSTAYAFADNQGLFKGFQKIRVAVNGKELNNLAVPGFVVDGKTVLPLRDVADSLGAAVIWDSNTQTVNLIKPNVHLLVAEAVNKDYSVKRVFGKVQKGKSLDFSVFTQVDDLSGDVSKVKIQVVDPFGTVADSFEQKLTDVGDAFWLVRPFEVKFSYAGDYKVQFYLQMDKDDDYTLFAEKTIVSD